MKRRSFLKAGAGAALAAGGLTIGYRNLVRAGTNDVYVMPVAGYESDLVAPLKTAVVNLIGGKLHGARCVVKPNLVELIPGAPVNTHPAVLAAVCEVLLDLGAGSVVVAEGPGHRRDVAYMLRQSGYLGVIDALHLDYVDLNLDDTVVEECSAKLDSTGRSFIFLKPSPRRMWWFRWRSSNFISGLERR